MAVVGIVGFEALGVPGVYGGDGPRDREV